MSQVREQPMVAGQNQVARLEISWKPLGGEDWTFECGMAKDERAEGEGRLRPAFRN
jgi:hypothetical protein